jgi:uncharacterized membrane protein SpoIIM required for sporulation
MQPACRLDREDSGAPGVLSSEAFLNAARFASRTFAMLTVPALTLLFLGVVVGLGAAVVWKLWEIEQTSKPRRNGDRFS